MLDAPERMNDSGTCTTTGTKLTQPRSGFGLAGGLHQMRRKHGFNSAIGHRCSNLCEMFKSLPAGPEHRIEYLTQDGVRYQRNRLLENIQRQSIELAELLAAQVPAIQGAQIR